MIHHESQTQRALIEWIFWNRKKYPALELLYAIPNGGKRNPREAARMKAEGVKAGIPDLCLPVGRHGCHSLYLETKTPGGKLSESQKLIIPKLQAEKNEVIIYTSIQEGIDYLEAYLG